MPIFRIRLKIAHELVMDCKKKIVLGTHIFQAVSPHKKNIKTPRGDDGPRVVDSEVGLLIL